MLFTQSLLLALWVAFGVYTLLVVLAAKGEPTEKTTRIGRLVYWHGVVFIGLLIVLAAWFLLQIVATHIKADLIQLG